VDLRVQMASLCCCFVVCVLVFYLPMLFLLQEEFANYEANDPWVQGTIVTLDTMLSSFKVACKMKKKKMKRVILYSAHIHQKNAHS
jgi:hypothetical protein